MSEYYPNIVQALLGAYLAYIIWTVKARPLYNTIKEKQTVLLVKHGSRLQVPRSAFRRLTKRRLPEEEAVSDPGRSEACGLIGRTRRREKRSTCLCRWTVATSR
jgi:hypothetical protein